MSTSFSYGRPERTLLVKDIYTASAGDRTPLLQFGPEYVVLPYLDTQVSGVLEVRSGAHGLALIP